MKERPILFNGDMVRAILDGRKTQTRRLVKAWQGSGVEITKSKSKSFWDVTDKGIIFDNIKCPLGKVGDQLWVRETWQSVHFSFDMESGYADDWYESEQILKGPDYFYSTCYAADPNWTSDIEDRGFSWRPSIHMPRWASRITLEITDIRVERLQDISEADALAEGVRTEADAAADGATWYDRPRRQFRFLWQSINGHESWEENPWVWVIEFKRVQE